MLLEINDLDITYGDNTPTVENVKLSLNEGEILTIVGESGSGKTTVIRS
ncbi:MAG TPA: ABC transporter ATP-binding protein, partial [Anaerovibrio sp.]|nr:ABC transporter ATP-binding protein [Anaerovibrio sp.]